MMKHYLKMTVRLSIGLAGVMTAAATAAVASATIVKPIVGF